MNCLKCGTETSQGQVFCNRCLAVMEQCPVKPGTPIHLPRQEKALPSKKSGRKKALRSPNERIRRLRRLCAGLAVLLLLEGFALGLLGASLMRTRQTLRQAQSTGKNYMVETTPTT